MTVRVALVGCGTVARTTHLPGLRLGGDADVVAFASRSLGSAERARDAWGSGVATTDWRDVVTRDDVDAVHVCVPNSLHAEVGAAALEAGKHVLVEKPITTTLADADALLALTGDQLLGVAFDGRCNPALGELRRRLPEIGALQRVDIALAHAGPQQWAPDATWFRDPALAGGGALMDLGVHVVDAVRWCAGEVLEVSAARVAGPVDEQAELDLLLTSGATASMRVSWRASEPEFAFRFHGEAGALELLGGTLLHDGRAVPVPASALRTAAGAFARAVATGTPPVADGADGRAALAVVLAGYAFADSAGSVRLA